MKDINKRIAKLSPAKRKLLEQKLQQKVKDANHSSIPNRENTQSAPLSFSQEWMWILDRLEPGNPAYNRPTNIRLTGSLNVTALLNAINSIVRRHEVLRTTFPMVDGQPIQTIAPSLTLKLPIIELSNLALKEPETEIKRIAVSEAQQRFDLSKLPLIQAKLLRLSEEEHILLLSMHHIIFDGWSVGVLLEELAAYYQAFVSGKPPSLPPLPIQYADFAIWQRQQLQGERLESGLDYWKKQLGGNLPILELPTDRMRSPQQTWRGAKLDLLLPPNLKRSLKELSLNEGVTLFMTLLTAFQILLYRYTGEEDIIVGTPVAGRDRAETEKAIGVFINTIPLRTQLNGNLSFRKLLAKVREVAYLAYSYQEIPFYKLVQSLQLKRDLSHTPIFVVLFQLRNLPSQVVDLEGLRIENCQLETGGAMLDLALEIEEQPEGLSCHFKYNSDLFDANTIERMAGHFQVLLEGIVTNPQQQVSQLPLLTQGEQHQLLIEWNNTANYYPQDKCIHQLFEEQVQLTPDAVAVVFDTERLTYRQLNNRANQLAHYLRSKGVAPEVLVGICVERSVEMLVGLLGILKAGGAYVPLDSSYPKERIAYMLEDSEVSVLLTQSSFVEKLPSNILMVVLLDTVEQSIASQTQENPVNQTKPDNLAYIIYTSGSTGKPKGVAVTHLGINRLVKNTNYIKLEPSDRVAQISNASFDAATFEIWGALVNGAQLVGIPQEVALSPEKFVTHILQKQINVVFLTTALFNQFATLIPGAFKPLKYLLFGGEAVNPTSVKKVLEHGAPEKLLHVYGPTENTTFSSWYLIEEVADNATTIPIGTPIANTQIYILDNHLQPVPIGIPGEIHLGGAGLARGYLNRPEITSQKFIPNPCGKPGSRLYKTGDLARYMPDGNIEYISRIDNQVKIRGFRIELCEIEAELTKYPQVKEAVAIARVDIPGDKRLVAYVVSECENADILITNLRGFLKQKLPQYMIPNAFCVLDALPLTPNGKVDRKALPAPDNSMPQAETFVAPRNSLELQLAQIWEKVLGIQPIGVTDNFFELGGHSLLTVRLVAEIEKVTQKKLPLAALFQFTTIEQILSVITNKKVADNANCHLSPELPPLDEDDLRALLTVAAGRKGARLRPDSLMNAIRSQGDKPPLFYCANATKEISSLAHYLGEEQPVYLLQSGFGVFIRKEQRTEDNIKAVAARHVRDILVINPTGPYLVVGYSFGKFVAYEVAFQLEQQGKQVKMLAILDTSGSALMYNCVRKVLQAVELFALTITQELFRGSWHSFTRELNSLFSRVKDNLTPKHTLNIFKPFSSKIFIDKHLKSNTNEGCLPYHPTAQNTKSPVGGNKGLYHMQGYQGKITLFLALVVRDRRFKILRWLFPLMGWEQHLVDTIKVPGNHYTMVYETHARVLADRLKTCIDKALDNES